MTVLMSSMLVLMLAGEASPEDRPVAPNVSVEGHYVADPEPAILFQLRALEEHTVYECDLPWGNFYSVRLSFHDRAGKSVCLLVTQPIDDPSDAQVLLRARQSISGRVKLLDYCRSLPRLLAQGVVTVDWVYTPVVLKGSGEPLHGQIKLPGSK